MSKPVLYNAEGAETFAQELSELHGEDTDNQNVCEEELLEMGYTPIKAWRKDNLVLFETGRTDSLNKPKLCDVAF